MKDISGLFILDIDKTLEKNLSFLNLSFLLETNIADEVSFRDYLLKIFLLRKKHKLTDCHIKINEQINDDNYFQDKNFFYLIDKILIICGFVISLTSLVLNATGIGLSSNYLNKPKSSSDLENTYYTCSILLLFENILITISWIYFTIYWLLSILKLIKKSKKKENEQQENIEKHNAPGADRISGNDAPLPNSTGREINEIR